MLRVCVSEGCRESGSLERVGTCHWRGLPLARDMKYNHCYSTVFAFTVTNGALKNTCWPTGSCPVSIRRSVKAQKGRGRKGEEGKDIPLTINRTHCPTVLHKDYITQPLCAGNSPWYLKHRGRGQMRWYGISKIGKDITHTVCRERERERLLSSCPEKTGNEGRRDRKCPQDVRSLLSATDERTLWQNGTKEEGRKIMIQYKN